MEGTEKMKKTLAIIVAILFMLPVVGAMALDYPTELDSQAAVKRIEDAKTYFLENGEGSDEDVPQARVIIDHLDLYNTGSLAPTQRLVIINN